MNINDLNTKEKHLYETENTEPLNVLLIGIFSDSSQENIALDSLDELRLLAQTSIGEGYENSLFYTLTQCRPNPDVSTYVGSGKAVEAGNLCLNNNISLVIVDGEMSPSQIRNLEDEINKITAQKQPVRVIDRTMLILDIFAKHAVTGDGKLQVEIAQLKYTAPRLTGKGIALSRQGGTSGSIGSRGPGETKLETDKRHIQRRILSLENALKEMENDRSTKRTRRIKSQIPMAVIAGYTNAGKSTLLNYLTDAGVLAQDKLFATLDPTVRNLKLPSGREILLSDTVGFISRLPHQLVKAFKSTLDEVTYADIVLVLIDSSDALSEQKKLVTEQILASLGCTDKNTLYVYNKCDKLQTVPAFENDSKFDSVYISATTGFGTDLLLQKIDDILSKSKKNVKFLFPFCMSSAVSNLYKNATVEYQEYTQDGIEVKALVDEKFYGLYKDYVIQ